MNAKVFIDESQGGLVANFRRTKVNSLLAEYMGFSKPGEVFEGKQKTINAYFAALKSFHAENPVPYIQSLYFHIYSGSCVVCANVLIQKPPRVLKTFEDGDGARYGISDLYPAKRYALQRAIAGKSDFTTGWFSSKKECVSGRITRVNNVYTVEVCAFDDLDREFEATRKFEAGRKGNDAIYARIEAALGVAHEEAENLREEYNG